MVVAFKESKCVTAKFYIKIIRNYSGCEVQGSTFRVKDKEGIEDPKSSLQMFIFPSNCQFGFKFWMEP